MWVWSLDGEDPLEGAWQPTPVFLLGELHGQRGLVVYSPQGHKESDTTEETQQACTYCEVSVIKLKIISLTASKKQKQKYFIRLSCKYR